MFDVADGEIEWVEVIQPDSGSVSVLLLWVQLHFSCSLSFQKMLEVVHKLL